MSFVCMLTLCTRMIKNLDAHVLLQMNDVIEVFQAHESWFIAYLNTIVHLLRDERSSWSAASSFILWMHPTFVYILTDGRSS